LPVLLATWIFAPPQAGEKDERRFEKRNLCSRVPRLRVHVAVFWSDAKSRAVLGGTLGENAAWCSGHGSSAQEDGCGLSPAAGPARHVVLCGHRSVFSSPPGRQNVSPPRIFSTNPGFDSLRQRHCDRDIGLTGLERSVPVHLGKRANSTHMSTLGGIMGRISARLTTVVT
jgi:hypothetical protein